MIHREIRLVLRMVQAVDRKECLLRISTPEMNQYIVEDCRVVEYRPSTFRDIRRLCGVDTFNLSQNYIFNRHVHSNSGSLLFFSADFKYVIKTIRETERKTLIEYVEKYCLYLSQNPSTFLVKVLWCYVLDEVSLCSLGCVSSQCTHRYNVLVMQNLFRDCHIDRVYDLKGKDLHRNTNRYIRKDLDWCRDGNRPVISPVALLQIQKDILFLVDNNIMDYSLMAYYTGPVRDRHFKLYDASGRNTYKTTISRTAEEGECVFGIVDILTEYTCLKKTEWLFNTFCLCKNKSSLNSKEYGERLLKIVQETFIVEETEKD